jgi:ABC-type sugar transport system ATPase subunit
MASDSPALRLVAIEKSFGGVRALRSADLDAHRGEIMGLCGENGAGKSTLLKVLSGVHPFGSYSGKVILDGEIQEFARPKDARRAGIAVVYQELTLVPELTVAQNLFLGREPMHFGLIDEIRMESMAKSRLARFGLPDAIDVTQPVARLGIGLQQMVEIMRALEGSARVLVLDEPTAALTSREADLLHGWLRALRDSGTTCVYVSHRLDEVFALCERITVLRDGRTAAVRVTRETTPEQIVRDMVGRDVEHGNAGVRSSQSTEPVIDVADLCLRQAPSPHARGASAARPFAVSGVSFSLSRGEVVAVCGAMGSGRTALLSTLFGCARGPTSGRIAMEGAPVTLDSPRTAIRHGIAFVPEDRKGAGLVPGMSITENLTLPVLASRDVMGPLSRVGLVDRFAEARLADRRMTALQIRGAPSASVATLSGGNQQKVVLGKWLETPPKVLLLDEPTRGVDVGAREEIYRLLEQLAQAGVAILFASSDLSEVLRLAQRILVLRDGVIVSEMEGASATQENIVRLSTGARANPDGAPKASADGATLDA